MSAIDVRGIVKKFGDFTAVNGISFVVEVYPYVPYVQYLLPGSVVMSIFMMVMMGGGIIYIDDKASGLHEGYLVTPITKFELIAGFNISGTIKAVLAGMFLLIIGSFIAGISDPLAPVRLFRLLVVVIVTAFALISLMFLLMVRVSDPMMPRAIFGVLNTLLYFPSGAVYPQQGFPTWMQYIAIADPFTYSVHDDLTELAIRPRIEYLSGVIARMTGCDPGDEVVLRCVGSLQSQALSYLHKPIATRLGLGSQPTVDEVDEAARHITAFSIAGIHAVAGASAEARQTSRSAPRRRHRAG